MQSILRLRKFYFITTSFVTSLTGDVYSTDTGVEQLNPMSFRQAIVASLECKLTSLLDSCLSRSSSAFALVISCFNYNSKHKQFQIIVH
jgi:hypothetical protein